MYYVTNWLTVVVFLKIARKWPALIQNWSAVENSMSGRYKTKHNLRRKLNMTATIFLITATSDINIYRIYLIAVTRFSFLVEHTMAIVNFVYTGRCNESSVGLDSYLKNQFSFVFRYFEYTRTCGILLLVIKLVLMMWSSEVQNRANKVISYSLLRKI